jgi:hypothetical protein
MIHGMDKRLPSFPFQALSSQGLLLEIDFLVAHERLDFKKKLSLGRLEEWMRERNRYDHLSKGSKFQDSKIMNDRPGTPLAVMARNFLSRPMACKR